MKLNFKIYLIGLFIVFASAVEAEFLFINTTNEELTLQAEINYSNQENSLRYSSFTKNLPPGQCVLIPNINIYKLTTAIKNPNLNEASFLEKFFTFEKKITTYRCSSSHCPTQLGGYKIVRTQQKPTITDEFEYISANIFDNLDRFCKEGHLLVEIWI